MQAYYDMIFKRKSMRKYSSALHISPGELEKITEKLQDLQPLDPAAPIRFRIVPAADTTVKWGEYCLLCYSDTSAPSLLNAGYMLEQMDLFFASMDIGACWYGLSKPDIKRFENLDYIIMLAFGKSKPEDFRKDITAAKRQPQDVIWQGTFDPEIITPARYAPSACNMQPWRVQSTPGQLQVFRTKDVHSIIMPPSRRPFFNTIDVGIFLCFLEISLLHHHRRFSRTLLVKKPDPAADPRNIPIASYTLL